MPTGKSLHVFLNYACQAKCPFCYNPPLTAELIRWKLPLETLARELLKSAKEGYESVTYSGGEVTLLKDLPQMILMAHKAGLKSAGIITNGLRLEEPEYLKELTDAGLNFCCVSVHADSAALHDEMTAYPGAFNKVVSALKNLTQSEIPWMLNFVLTERNYNSLPQFLERFSNSACQEFQIYFPHYEGLMQIEASSLGLSMSDALPVLRQARQAARDLGIEEKVWFYNMPPCAASGLEGRLRNWENEEGDSLLVDPKGGEDGVFFAQRKDRLKTETCANCALNEKCLGLESGYAQRFGTQELRALALT